ncbi:MAG TPA: SRPBCC domain-containing protein [Chitinivibrionales bacterium]|nr:SRPBCC domain-containing protein [Chitinivibrionales bacterium]
MKKSFTVSAVFPVSPAALFKAWLSSREHSAFTGSLARISAKVNGTFSAWDGYISGRTIKLAKDRKIVQRWRTTEFAGDDPDSLVEITLKKAKNGTKLTLGHSGIPEGQSSDYRQGWQDFYFKPMREYFSK